MHYKRELGIAVLAMMLAIFLAPGVLAIPDGATITTGTPVTKGFFASTSVLPLGGAMTNISIDTETQTIAWQGFFGEVEGNLTLEDSTGNQFFNWTGFDSGTVLASRDSNVDFSNISPQNDCTIDEGLTGTRSDRVNNTFTSSSNTPFTIGTTTIAAGTACALNSYVNSAAQALNFEEIILTDDGGTTSIYATRIDKDTTGFDSSTHDFQLLVPDNRNESISTYYVYVELE